MYYTLVFSIKLFEIKIDLVNEKKKTKMQSHKRVPYSALVVSIIIKNNQEIISVRRFN